MSKDKTAAEWLDTFAGEHVYDVKWTATLDGETRTGEITGVRADRPGSAQTRVMLLLTNPDGDLRRAGWTGMEMRYDVTQVG